MSLNGRACARVSVLTHTHTQLLEQQSHTLQLLLLACVTPCAVQELTKQQQQAVGASQHLRRSGAVKAVSSSTDRYVEGFCDTVSWHPINGCLLHDLLYAAVTNKTHLAHRNNRLRRFGTNMFSAVLTDTTKAGYDQTGVSTKRASTSCCLSL